MAKIKGLYVVGSAGSDEKVDFLLNTLKIDAAFNYKKVDLYKVLFINFFLFPLFLCIFVKKTIIIN
jgi:NADPH-dependent curcumin reductase CurA